MSEQLLLGVVGHQRVDFESLYLPTNMRMTVATIKRCIEQADFETIYLSGMNGVGKSHILQAACHYAVDYGHKALYLPIKELIELAPEAVFEQHGDIDYLFLDDVDVIEADQNWQQALFHVFNERVDKSLSMFFSASEPALKLALGLKDLQSRLASCLSFQLPRLDDEQKMQVLQNRAEQIGMLLPTVCAQYIVQHYSRDMHQLMAALVILDVQSLRQSKKLTIPFIKQVLSNDVNPDKV